MLPKIDKPEDEDTKNQSEKKDLVTKAEFKEFASTRVLKIHFTKVDGSDRWMRCTLRQDFLPKSDIPGLVVEQVNRKENDNVVAVWDLDNSGWRSFRLSSLLEIETTGE